MVALFQSRMFYQLCGNFWHTHSLFLSEGKELTLFLETPIWVQEGTGRSFHKLAIYRLFFLDPWLVHFWVYLWTASSHVVDTFITVSRRFPHWFLESLQMASLQSCGFPIGKISHVEATNPETRQNSQTMFDQICIVSYTYISVYIHTRNKVGGCNL